MRKKLLFLFAALLSFIGTQSAKAQHDYVDLGLPSGTLWATCNVGANAPEEYGKYFAWGEIEDKSNYTWDSYLYCYQFNYDPLIKKYCNNSRYGKDQYTDDLTELQPMDDVATALWGGGWQMPSASQFEELINSDYTTVEVAVKNYVGGCKITSKINGNSIFLPFAGGYQNSSSIDYVKYNAFYWSRSLSLADCRRAHLFSAGQGGSYEVMKTIRCHGYSVRPVRNPVAYVISNIPDGWQVNGTTTTGSYEVAKGGSVVFTPVNIPAGKKIKSVKVIKE